jgi:hypothetical protein
MKTFLIKAATSTVCSAIAVAGLSGLGILKQTVNAAAYYTPRLIVTGSEVSVDRVNAGDEFDLTVHFTNESEDTHLYNIKIAFSSNENVIYPAAGTSVYYVDSVEDEEDFDVTIRMATRSDLEEKPYTINVSYEFEDSNKAYYQDSSEIVIPVYQKPVLTASDLRLTKNEIELNNKTSFSMKLNNMGKGNIYNVSVAVDGDMINGVDTVVGNLDKGTDKTVDLSLKGTSVASGNINVTVTYEDSVGQQYTIEKQMNLSVIEPAPIELVTDEAATMNLVPVVVAVIVAIVVIIVVVNIIRKVREKKYA